MKGQAAGAPDFDVAQTLECGQCFRWEKQEDGAYLGVAGGRVLRIHPEKAEEGCRDPFWKNYFDLGRDYAAIRGELASRGGVMARAAAHAPGIHILNQDPWEALCSFIISQNNNIPRIRGIIARMCASYGRPLPEGGNAFPSAARLSEAGEAELRALGCGFRAPYLMDAAKKISAGTPDLEELRGVPMESARKALMAIKGVGPKVAECTLLYGLHRLEAFPMDVWMIRAMKELFPGETPESFGLYAGIAQQYIFHYVRTGG